MHFDPLCASAKMIRSRRQWQVTKLAGKWWCYRLPGFCTQQVQSTSAREGQANSDRQWHKDSRCMKYVAQPSLELVICLGSKCRDVYIQNCVAHPVLKQFCSFTLACRQRLCSSWNAWESECASCYRVQQALFAPTPETFEIITANELKKKVNVIIIGMEMPWTKS